MPDRRPTINDVAKQTGVSKATVSAVLNDSPSVKTETRNRVLAAIELLNYRPTQQNRVGAERRHKSIALLIKEYDNPYYDEVTAGVRSHAEKEGYVLFVVSSEGAYEAEHRAVTLFRDKDVDGLIAAPVLDKHADLSHFFELKRRNFPFVLLEEVRGVPASLVDVENISASQQAVEYLFSLGHHRVAHFAGPAYSTHSQERADGFRRAYSASHLVLGDTDVIETGAHLEDGYRCARELFESRSPGDRPTAVTCYNDLVAMGVCKALRDIGLDCPGDVSVIGYDDISFCESLAVPLTTVSVPMFDMGRIAAEMLVAHIESRKILPPRKVYLESKLVIRASSAPPRKDAAAKEMRVRGRGSMSVIT